MLRFSREPSIHKVCLKHKFKLIKIVEPNEDKKIDGYKLYKCKVCGKEYKEPIFYKNYFGGML